MPIITVDRKGATRIVILTRNYAFKIPNFHDGYSLFIRGILCNLQEYVMGKDDWCKDINPTIYGNRFGLLNIQPRLRHVRHRGLFWVEYKRMLILTQFKDFISSDAKPENFGYAKGMNLLKLDYGS